MTPTEKKNARKLLSPFGSRTTGPSTSATG